MNTAEAGLTRRRFGKVAWAACAAALGAAGALAGAAAAPYLSYQLEKGWREGKQRENAAAAEVTGANSLGAHAAARGFLFGAAVDPELLDLDGIAAGHTDDGYTRLFADQTRILVAENAMKWDELRPTPERFDFSNADRMIRFAQLTGKQVRGHNLCWHVDLPDWFEAAVNKGNARQFLIDHIRTVAGHFRGQVQSWDVVNEAVWLQDGRPDGLRRQPWLELVGPDYIELAFRTAADADPGAKLTYNEFGLEGDGSDDAAKRAQVLALLQRLKKEGVPLHAVGVQSHLWLRAPAPGAGLKRFLSDVAALGLEVYLTEMDVVSAGIRGGEAVRDRAVARMYGDYVSTMMADPNIKMLLTWGLSSANSWVNSLDERRKRFPDVWHEQPLPFDDEFVPTEAFWTLRDALDTRKPASE